MSPAVESTLERLEETRQRWWMFSMLCSLIVAVGASLGLLLVFVLLDVLIQFSRAGLGLLFACWACATAAVVGNTVFRLLRHQRTPEAAARRVELSFPELGSHLINLLQLARVPEDQADPFQEAALREAVTQVGDLPFDRAAEKQTRWERWRIGLQTPRDAVEFGGALMLLLLCAYGLSVAIPKWSSSAERLFKPWKFVPQVGVVRILEVTPGDAEVLTGSRVEITAKIAPLDGRRAGGTLVLLDAAGQETTQRMVPNSDNSEFTFALPAVLSPVKYRLQIGDSQSKQYTIGVRDKPTVEEVEVTYEHPQYLGLPDAKVVQRHADLEAPQLTIAHLRIKSKSVLSRGYAQIDEQRVAGEVDRTDPHYVNIGVWMAKPGSFTVHLFNELDQGDSEPRVNSIRVTPDGPPTVQIVKPGVESIAAPGDELPVAVRAADDHGLSDVRLEWKVTESKAPDAKSPDSQSSPANSSPATTPPTNSQPANSPPSTSEVHVVKNWPQTGKATTAALTHAWKLDATLFQPGQIVMLRAVAKDARQFNRRIYGQDASLAPQETASAWHRVKIVAADERAGETLSKLESINSRLWQILQNQLRARVIVAGLMKRTDLAEARLDAQNVRQKQVQVQTAANDLVGSINPNEGPEFVALRQALAKLAHGDMIVAVQNAEALTGLKSLDQTAELAPPLADTQERVIDILRRLLDASRRATSDVLSEMKERPGQDLPPDVQQKLKDLYDKLQEFLKQQKKIIEATENLAKKPVEDFTEEDEQKLKEMAQAEDDWSRFMEEAHSDLSKLPEQDFANPSMLEEMIEVMTELKMAEGALTKKTADIAVPLEQLGAEMAEQMTTNIEKWLPDTPDRERWSQEEPISDEMKEAPMAELPGELEDIVGELMEDEEDLFDEMEDASSSWADSLDKGAGWDAMDGPISNMSARGVTGNRLPNSSEIGGRSGEGRQGKSSGEFVGDTAVGKGGRKTPSRLTPDAFVKGQVKDISKDPVGGATGGGKESGGGGEGLEGPVGNRPQRDMERLAQKQAELRNKAEAVDVKFKVLNYHHTDLKKLVDVMAAVESDLKSGRYQSALRRREVVLDGLGNLKTYLQGEMELRKDDSVNLPEQIQKELLNGMQELSPQGWEELNRRYFERLSSDK